jgi:hypothetical protein
MSDKRISISLDEYNMLHTETLAQKDTITRLTEERDALADDRDGYVQLLTDQNTRLTAEVEKLKKEIIGRQAHDRMQVREIKHLTAEVAEYEAIFDAQWNADMAGVQMWREAHPGNDMVLPDRKRFTAWILAEVVVQRVENEKLRAALLVARKYVLVQSCELSLMPEDAARDLDVIDEALEEDDD